MALIQNSRYESVDALRGVAIVWMTVFHFCFDLSHFGYLNADFYNDPFWTLQRTAIVTLFLSCAGFGQALATQQGQTWTRFWHRWAQIALCAGLVSVASYAMYPRSFIYFGILHGIAVMLIVARLTVGWGRWLWLLGVLAWGAQAAAPFLHKAWSGAEVLNMPALNWLGLISRIPITEDYVPLLPWLGVMWWAMATGTWLARQRPAWMEYDSGPVMRPLAFLGRWSLSYYMLHQPVLIGALMLLASGTGCA